MEEPVYFVRSPRLQRRLGHSILGFSLIEVVVAVGIVAVAIIPMVGMLPSGLNTFRSAMQTSVTSQIAQKIINDAEQSDFNSLVGLTAASPTSTGSPPGTPWSTLTVSTRYFDVDGNELDSITNSIYQANTRATPLIVPGSNTTTGDMDVAMVTVQVVYNSSDVALSVDGTLLWSGTTLPMKTYSAIVARNQ